MQKPQPVQIAPPALATTKRAKVPPPPPAAAPDVKRPGQQKKPMVAQPPALTVQNIMRAAFPCLEDASLIKATRNLHEYADHLADLVHAKLEPYRRDVAMGVGTSSGDQSCTILEIEFRLGTLLQEQRVRFPIKHFAVIDPNDALIETCRFHPAVETTELEVLQQHLLRGTTATSSKPLGPVASPAGVAGAKKPSPIGMAIQEVKNQTTAVFMFSGHIRGIVDSSESKGSNQGVLYQRKVPLGALHVATSGSSIASAFDWRLSLAEEKTLTEDQVFQALSPSSPSSSIQEQPLLLQQQQHEGETKIAMDTSEDGPLQSWSAPPALVPMIEEDSDSALQPMAMAADTAAAEESTSHSAPQCVFSRYKTMQVHRIGGWQLEIGHTKGLAAAPSQEHSATDIVLPSSDTATQTELRQEIELEFVGDRRAGVAYGLDLNRKPDEWVPIFVNALHILVYINAWLQQQHQRQHKCRCFVPTL